MDRELRLKQLLQEHLDRLGSLSALARAIAEAHRKPPGSKGRRGLDRRKLQDILAGKDVPLHIHELEALDDFLNNYHQGLAFVPIFYRPTLLPTLAAQKQVHFLVGAREINGNIGVSHFDTNAYADLVRFLNSPSPGVTCELEVVLMRATLEEARNIQNEAWQRILQTERAVVAIASPLSNHGTDSMLAQMFECPAYKSPFEARRRPPIAFVLPEPYLAQAFSSFVEGPDQLPKPSARKAREIRDRCWALRVGDDVFVVDPEQEDVRRSKTYGVIVAQRRANGHVWVVAAGLHGAGTHAAALALPGAEISLASGRLGEDGPVHVRVVEAHVTFTTSSTGTKIRKVDDQRILTKFNRTFDLRRGPEGQAPVTA